MRIAIAIAVMTCACDHASNTGASDGATDSAYDGAVDASLDASSAANGIPPTLFGLSVRYNQNPWPTLTFATTRTLGPAQGTWGHIETADGVYDWTYVDAFVADAEQYGLDVVFTLNGTPTWASSTPSDATCASFMPPGGCDAPVDLAADGTGTDQHLITFAHDLAVHVAGKIHYFETWNEPNLTSGTMWHGTTPQLVRMSADLAAQIKAVDPTAQILSPGAASATAPAFIQDYLANGGGQYADIIAFHGYTQVPEKLLVQAQSIRTAMAANGVSAKRLWDTEASWGANSGLPDFDEERGFVARFYLMHATAGVDRLLWYGYGQGAYDPTQFGTLWDTTDGLLSPGVAYGVTQDWLVGATLATLCSATGTVWTCELTRPGGYDGLVVWDASKHCANGTCQTSSYSPDERFTSLRDLARGTQLITGPIAIGAVPVLLETP